MKLTNIGFGLCRKQFNTFPFIIPATYRVSFHKYSTQKSSPISIEDASKPTLEVDSFARSKAFQRPTSPHLTIYQPQLTWYMSGLHRITGAGVATGKICISLILYYIAIYGGAIAFGLGVLNPAGVAAWIHSFHPILVFTAKTLVGSAFVYHSLNGIRHLVYNLFSFLIIFYQCVGLGLCILVEFKRSI